MEIKITRNSPLLWLLFPACLILILIAYYPLERSVLALRYPFQLDYAEGYIAAESWMITQGESIYPPLSDYPYLVGNYPPVYPFLCAPFFLLFGASLFWGRLFCVISALGICGVMIFIIWRKTRAVLPSLLAPLIFINTYALYEWIGYARVDLPAIFFSLLGLAFILESSDKGRLRWALVFFILSVYTKQVQFFAPLAACLYLFWRDKKIGLRFAAWFAGLVIGIFLVLCICTKGEYYKHTVVYNANVFSWWQIKVWLRHVFLFHRYYLLLIILTSGFVFYKWFKEVKEIGAKSPDLFSIYAAVGALSFFTIGKVGAASNYLLEFYAALGLFFGLNVSRVFDRMQIVRKKIPALILIFFLAFLFNMHAFHLLTIKSALFSRPNPLRADWDQGRLMLDIVRDYPDPILCEQPIFLILAGKKVVFQPFIMSQLHKESKWNQVGFIRDIRKKRFSLIMTGQDMFDPEIEHLWQYTEQMRNTIRDHYKPLFKEKSPDMKLLITSSVGIPYYIYIPRQVKDE